MAEETHTLYRMFAEDDRLLYVGISCSPGRRFREHEAQKFWWGDVAKVELQHFPDRESLEFAEAEAIESESPIHNKIAGVPKRIKTQPEPTTLDRDEVIGRFFVGSLDGVSVEGRVVGSTGRGMVIVSYRSPEPPEGTVVSLAAMEDWDFFDREPELADG